jgi:hypothetical protein
MADEFDPTPYVRPPIVDVPSGVALGIALLSAAPKPAPPHVKSAAKKVHAETVALQAAWAKADGGPVQTDKRKADMRIDNAWGILLDRLEAYASLPIEKFSKAARARVLIDTVSKSREWLKMPYGAEWAESGKRLQKIDEEGLAPDIEALAGPEFLKEVRQAHKAYGIALGVTEAAPEALEINLSVPLRTLSRAIGRYGIAVAGMADDDPATLAMVRKALRPIDDYREAQARRTSSGGSEEPAAPKVTPTTPVPEPK